MALKVTNNATGALASGIAAGAGSLTLQAGQGAKFPSLSAGDYFYCTLIQSDGDFEIIKVTARSGDSFTTIVRAQDGTSALPFVAGDIVSLRPIRAIIEDIQDSITNIITGTGDPPAAGTVPEGTVYLKYVA